jgi:hypothetical protein
MADRIMLTLTRAEARAHGENRPVTQPDDVGSVDRRFAGHADPRTTNLYDRRKRKISRNIVERISV